MRLLLDTHAILWALAGDRRLSTKARRLFEDSEEIFFSVVSLWEIGITLGLRRSNFVLDGDWSRQIPQTLVSQGAVRVDVDSEHCALVAELPLHHRDPFDRMLIAQAIGLGSQILSIDHQFDAYAVKRVW